MNTVETDAVAVANQVAPESIAVEAVNAAISTAADPSVMNIVSDLELAHTLVNEFKTKMAGLHPSVANFFKAIF